MAVATARQRRNAAGPKRELILDAAQRVFEAEGLAGASLRSIAAAAGYTPAALYFHFESKEALYAELLARSLASLTQRVTDGVVAASGPAARLRAATLAFFDFYAENPRDLALGFYLWGDGLRPHGVGRERNDRLNGALAASLRPIADAATELGAPAAEGPFLVVDLFSQVSGVLLLMHTGRIRMFDVDPRGLVERRIEDVLAKLGHGA